MLQPFEVAEATLDSYRRYVRTSFPLRDENLDAQRERLIDEGLLWREPYISLARPGTTGPKLESLRGRLHDRTLDLPWGFSDLYAHQEQTINRLTTDGKPQNTLVLSGTGSGKTEAFLVPVVDACFRNPGAGIKAVVIYPMNALANDQLKRLTRLLAAAPEITFGRYTGDAPETDLGDKRPPRPADLPDNALWSRAAMRDAPPDILLTNYTQLEYLLLRGKDKELFAHGAPLYLIVDEIHLFTGVLGAEVACLLRRFRQHVKADPGDICCVGTSATAGSEGEQERLLAFAGAFFGSEFGTDAAVAETPAPFREVGSKVPDPPTISDEDLAAADSVEGLAALAGKALGVNLKPDSTFDSALAKVIDEFATVGVVERVLDHPSSISRAAAALAELPQRSGVDLADLEREATALLLIGASATEMGTGEMEPQPRFRPRLHQVVRSLAGLWRCLDPACGQLVAPGAGLCPACGSAVLPLASCRTCGEAYWTGRVVSDDLAELEELGAVEPRRDDPAVFLADPARLDEVIMDTEDGGHVQWDPLRICSTCRHVASARNPLGHARGCSSPGSDGISLLGSTDDIHCPSCGHQGTRNRPILLVLRGSAAASAAILTQSLSDELREREGEAGGRLLVFADSRQDAAQQAGYADDQGARVSIRQLLREAIAGEAISLAEAIRRVKSAVTSDKDTLLRWLVGESDDRFGEVSDPSYIPSKEDEEQVARQIEWEIALEVTERGRRRFSLEREGLLIVTLDRIDELVATVNKTWPTHPFGGDDRLKQVILATVDVLRYARAVDHWMLKRTPRALSRNHHVRIGDRGVTSTRGFGSKKYTNAGAQVDIRSWTAPKNATRMTELIGRVLHEKPVDVGDAVETLAARLHSAGVFTQDKIEGRNRVMVDHKRLVLAPREDQSLWRCDRCGSLRATVLRDLGDKPQCINWRCPGTPREFVPEVVRDFYRRQYESEPRRLIVKEHSGQIESDERIVLEERFNDRQRPLIDALACTPTLEVGVSLDDLHAIILRNLPPTPANYAQRVGRAGRRSKVGLSFAHAGAGPHDTYFFERPTEMISGLVKAPQISLDNQPLLRRHVNSLVLEMLGEDLPSRWVPPIDDPEDFVDQTVADSEGVLRESTLKPFDDKLSDAKWRAAVDEAVKGAFASQRDPSPPAEATAVCADQVDRFLGELRVALNRWCNRYRALLDEYNRIRKLPGVPTQAERDLEKRLEQELRRLAAPKSPEYQPLGFLGLVGFLPRYGFTGETVLLHPPRGEEPIAQSAWFGVTEFAPGNLVYARGRKLKITRLDPVPVPESDAGAEHRDNVLRQARRCDHCEFLTFDLLIKTCPNCGRDLLGLSVIELTGVRGSGGAISSEDEYRSRASYDVSFALAEPREAPEQISLGGYTIERSAGREITVANRGRRPTDGDALGFDVCTGCGLAVETAPPRQPGDEDDEETETRGHLPRCPARNGSTDVVKSSVRLIARIRGDVMEIRLPEAARDPHFAHWRASLAEALKLGIRETLQAGQRDIDAFERKRDEEPFSIVLFDTMPGGTGYMPKLFGDGALGLKNAAALAARRLEDCDCADSCHRCLRDFWNQRFHEKLNRFEVIGPLRRLAEGEAVAAADPEDEKLESFLEIEFFERLSQAGLPTPTLQVVREIGGRRILRADAVYRDPDISIFLDGRAFHAQTMEKILDDIDTRNRLEARGELVLEFTYGDVMERFDSVSNALKRALKGEIEDADLEPKSLKGLEVLSQDERRRIVIVQVRPGDWLKNEEARAASLDSANRFRLAGWRLVRQSPG